MNVLLLYAAVVSSEHSSCSVDTVGSDDNLLGPSAEATFKVGNIPTTVSIDAPLEFKETTDQSEP